MSWHAYYELFVKYQGDISQASPQELQAAAADNPQVAQAACAHAARQYWRERWDRWHGWQAAPSNEEVALDLAVGQSPAQAGREDAGRCWQCDARLPDNAEYCLVCGADVEPL